MEILNKWDENPELFLQRIVTGDETWLYQYDPEGKTQSKQWLPKGGSGPVKAKSERSRGKVMATVFWDAEGILLVDFLENKKNITAIYYEEILRKLSKKIAEKRPGKLHRRVLFHHDNAPAHGARQTRAVLREFRWEIIRHPPYSLDLAPSDFFLFPNLKKSLKAVVQEAVAVVPKAEAVVQEAVAVVPEAEAVAQEAEAVVQEAVAVVQKAEAVVQEAVAVVPEAEAVVQEAEAVVSEAEAGVQEAEAVVQEAVAVVQEAEAVVQEAVAVVQKVKAVVQEAEAVVQEAEAVV
ncbi:Transposase type 1 [Trinorchestia longiramus]|nr:Transposase type 1 [Trinorchestia longiramus]